MSPYVEKGPESEDKNEPQEIREIRTSWQKSALSQSQTFRSDFISALVIALFVAFVLEGIIIGIVEPYHVQFAGSPRSERHLLPLHPRQAEIFADPEIQTSYINELNKAVRGYLLYKVHDEMEVSKPDTMTVRIYGPSTSIEEMKSFGQAEGDKLKVISTMLVTLTEPDNPDSFVITPEPGSHSGQQFVRGDGYAEWDWNVSPSKSGEKKLHITVQMVFYSKLPDGAPLRTEVASYDAVVKVKVKPFLESVEDWVKENWKELLKYLLPSGVAATVFAYVFGQFRNRGGRRDETEAEVEDDEEEKP